MQKKQFLFIFIALIINVLSSNAQEIRTKNDAGQWILLNPTTGKWRLEDSSSIKTATSTAPPTQPIIVEPNRPAVTPPKTEPVRFESGLPPPAEPKPQPVAQPSLPPVPASLKTEPTPQPSERFKTIIIDGKEMQVPDSDPYVKAGTENSIKKDTSNPTAIIDTTKTGKSDVVGSEFATPDDEYRTKAAAAGAATKQDNSLTPTKKPKKEKKPKEEKPTAEKPKEVAKKKPKKSLPDYCELAVNADDEFTGIEKRVTKAKTLFSYTPAAAKKYMRAEDYLQANASMSRIGSFKTLNLNIVIDSEFGQSEYGEIPVSGTLMIKMIDGSTIELQCDKGDVGRIDKIKKQTIYNVFYVLDLSQERQLKNGEASKVRIVWSVGFEDYEIYDLDFFKQQISCIE